MKAHLQYLRYVLWHKWFVFLGCMRLGVPLHQAILHDSSKFSPAEWGAYVAKFYGSYPEHDPSDPGKWMRRGYYGPTTADVAIAFDSAWNHHQKHNPHHWQYWLLITDSDAPRPRALPIPQRFVLEMVADWYGAGRAITGKNDLARWYAGNREWIMLEEGTRARVEEAIARIATR